ncbi:MAG: adenylyltransferase/cytidyltransferase family protein [bacterium]|nr:adenylyltransferase/cytidyltransferase family protein [bacterium]
MCSHKILTFEQTIEKVRQFRTEGRIVVQSFGIFDIIHPGIIKHLNSAKKQGDVLVVAVVKDKDVRRGPGRPIFSENFRIENVASLEMVDYACLVDDDIPFESVKKIQPDVFAHGRSLKERDQQIQRNTFLEEKELYMGKCRVYDTGGFSFSSTQIIENFLDIYPQETKQFLQQFSKRYAFEDVVSNINSLRNLKVLIIGDGIIDEYHYCEPMGRSAKTPLVVHRYLYAESYAGGAFAIANHLAGMCDEVHLLSLLGESDSHEELIRNALKPNIESKFFYRPDGPTVVKKRYVSRYNHQKLFEVNFLKNEFINGPCEENILKHLQTTLSHYDLVLVSDFGHGFITQKIIRAIEKYANVIAVNTQTNAANAGYNMITKYQSPHFVCLDEPEMRWAAQERFADLEQLTKGIAKTIQADYLMVTQGKKGSFGFDRRNDEINRTPIFSSKVIDTIGAGDAFFSFTAPCFAKNMPLDFVSFIGNAVGALAVQIIGNKRSVEKHELLEFIHALLK